MIYQLAADFVVIVHLAFILFILCGGFFALRWPKAAWIHLPTVAYGAAIEFIGWICPLTPLENSLRESAGQQGYSGGFVDQYILPVIYPAGLTEDVQIALGLVVLLVNAVVYAGVIKRHSRSD